MLTILHGLVESFGSGNDCREPRKKLKKNYNLKEEKEAHTIQLPR